MKPILYVFLFLISFSAGANPVIVQTGDTLYSLSRRHQVSLENLRQWNRLGTDSISVGQMLYISKPIGTDFKDEIGEVVSGTHVVVAGETLFSISRQSKVSVSDLKKYNGLLNESLQVGQILRLSSPLEGNMSRKTTKVEPNIVPKKIDLPIKKLVFVRPLSGTVLSDFGLKPSGLKNDGINIQADLGVPFYASEDGEVVFIGNSLKGFGNTVILKHSSQFHSVYAHASEISVHIGDFIQKGEVLGTVGRTGKVLSPQLHFEIRKDLVPQNPTKLFDL